MHRIPCLFLSSALIFSIARSEEHSLARIYERARRSIVGIAVEADRIRKKDYIFRGRYYGTGFFVAKNLILTTQKVVQDRTVAGCILYNRDSKIAKVVAYDKKSPLVLLKIEAPEIEPLPLQPQTEIGDIALVVGNPYKSISRVYQTACSIGVISGRYTFRRGKFSLKGAIETDAAVNPGNYGGPLLNVHGEAVGVLFSGYLESRMSGLAIPPAVIFDFLRRFEEGKIPVPDEIFVLQSFPVFTGLSLRQQGPVVIVADVDSDSPAQDAGIRSGDVVLKVGSQLITTVAQFHSTIQRYFVGQRIEIVVKRGSRVLEIPVVLRTQFM